MKVFSFMTHFSRHREFFVMVMIGALVPALFGGCAYIKQLSAPVDLEKEEGRLTESIKEEQLPYNLSDAHLQRARLRMRADNPRIDYGGALEDLKQAVSLNPGLAQSHDISDWIAALGRLADFGKEISQLKAKNEQAESLNRALRTSVELAERLNRALRISVEQLEKQEQELRKTIEELQSLQLQMEQRRQHLR
jgi:chromosome segregation ATPase